MKQDLASGEESLRRSAVKGVTYTGIQSIATRVFLLISQIVLGWLLTPAEFGVSALAGTISTLAWNFETFGTDEVLVQRGKKIWKWERTVFAIGLSVAGIAAILLVVIAPFVSKLFGEDQIAPLLYLSAASLVIASFNTVPAAKVRHAFDFKWFAGVNLMTALIIQSLTIVFAALGFGALSFFLPVPFAQTFRLIMFWRRAAPTLGGKLNWRQTSAVLNRSIRVFVARLAETILTQADYFILGLFALTGVVGFYNFAFRLAAVPVRVLGTNLRVVLVPMLTRLRSDQARQTRASVEAAELLAFVVTPLCFFVAACAEPGLRLLFGEKWINSVLLLQILSIGLPAEAVLGIARAQMTARGQFTRAMRYALLSVLLFVILVTIGAGIGKDVGTAIAVTSYSLIVSPLIFFRVFPVSEKLFREIFRIFGRPALLGGAASFAGWGITEYLGQDLHPLYAVILTLGISSLAYWALIFWTYPIMHKRMVSIGKLAVGKRVAGK